MHILDRRTFSGLAVLTILLIGVLALSFNVQPVKAWAGTVYIRADGSIDPLDAPITTSDNVTYTLTGNITSSGDGIVVERDSIILNGAGFTVNGVTVTRGTGVNLAGRSNVTVRNMKITGFDCGVCLDYSLNNSIIENNVTANWNCDLRLYSSSINKIIGNRITGSYRHGVYLCSSTNNSIVGNSIAYNCMFGIRLEYSSNNNSIVGNNVTANNWYGIYLFSSLNNSIVGNNVTANLDYSIALYESSYCSIVKNNIADNGRGISVCSSNNKIWHNNFVNNLIVKEGLGNNVWDDGYPSGGNYWSDYKGVDADGDGIGDTAYVIDEDNRDRYPLMNPWGSGTPVASFSWSPSTPEVGELVTFNASASMPIGGEIVSYKWDFGDGNHATGEIVTHAYDSAGTFTVTLNVTDSEGLWDIEQKQIEVKAPPPPLTVSISPLSASILVGQSVTFTSTVSGGYTPYSYQWYLNNNPVSGAISSSWTSTPTESGIYYVHLKVTDDKGNTAQSDTARIAVTAVPVGGYSIPIQAPATATPLTPYLILTAILTIAFTTIKRKTTKKAKKPP